MINTVETPETDAQITTFTSISKYGKHFENKTGTVSAEFARELERERNEWRESGYELYEAMVAALDAKDWKVDGACNPDEAMKRFLKLEEKYGWE